MMLSVDLQVVEYCVKKMLSECGFLNQSNYHGGQKKRLNLFLIYELFRMKVTYAT